MPWSTAKFLNEIRATATGIAATIERKNADYAGGDRHQDPFANFQMIETLTHGRITAEDGIVVRLTDKLARLINLSDADPAVTDESFADTAEDLAAYAMILGLLRRSRTEPDDVAEEQARFAAGATAVPDPLTPRPSAVDQLRTFLQGLSGAQNASPNGLA